MWRNSTRTLNPVRGKDNEQPLDDILHIKGSSNSIVFLKHWVTSALDSDPWLTGFLFLIPILQSPTRSQRDQHALLWRIIVREMSLVWKAHQNNERYVFLWAPESVSCERLASEACGKWKTYVSVGTFSRVFSNPFYYDSYYLPNCWREECARNYAKTFCSLQIMSYLISCPYGCL